MIVNLSKYNIVFNVVCYSLCIVYIYIYIIIFKA